MTSELSPPPDGAIAASTTPRVFIGLPVYNGARFLEEALDSLLAQSYRDFTLLISDNASTDSTQSICHEYAARDARIRYVRQPSNIGAPRNWNFVTKKAEGDYFKWATGNDLVAPDMLARCVEALDADPAASLSQGRTCLVDEDSGASKEYEKDLALLDDRPTDRLKQLAMKLGLNNGQSGLIRLSLLRKTRMERLYPNGDIALMAELALLGKFIVLPEVLLYRRMGATTFSCLLRGDQRGQFYGNQAMQPLVGHQLKLHLDVVRATLTLPLPWSERLSAFIFSLRYLSWNKRQIWAEFRQALGSQKA